MHLSSVFHSVTTGVMGDRPQGCVDELGLLPTLEEHPVEKTLHEIPRVIESERGHGTFTLGGDGSGKVSTGRGFLVMP